MSREEEKPVLIRDYRPVEDRGAIQAMFTVVLPEGINIRECKLIETHKGRFIGMPSRGYVSASGRNTWINQVFFRADVKKAYRDKILAAMDKFLSTGDEYEQEDE